MALRRHNDWPRNAARFPPIDFLLRQSIPLMKPPTPLPALLVESHERYLITLSTAVLDVEAATAAAAVAADALAATKKDLTSFNRWKDVAGKAGLQKRLLSELQSCEKSLLAARINRDQILKKGEELVKLVLLQARMEKSYAEYMIDLKDDS